MRRTRLALAAPALALGLALTGCAQPEEANDNGPQDQPSRPGEIRRTPQSDPSASLTVDPPGPTRSP